MDNAEELPICIEGKQFRAVPRVFSTGSYGWNLVGEQMSFKLNNQNVDANITINLVVHNSRPEPK